MVMSAFAVAIGGKADMLFCNAGVYFWPQADIAPAAGTFDGPDRQRIADNLGSRRRPQTTELLR